MFKSKKFSFSSSLSYTLCVSYVIGKRYHSLLTAQWFSSSFSFSYSEAVHRVVPRRHKVRGEEAERHDHEEPRKKLRLRHEEMLLEPQIRDFTIDQINGRIIILSPPSVIYVYDRDGNFLLSKDLKVSSFEKISTQGNYIICNTKHLTS